MFVTRRSPIKGMKAEASANAHREGGAGEAILILMAGLGAIGGLAYLLLQLEL